MKVTNCEKLPLVGTTHEHVGKEHQNGRHSVAPDRFSLATARNRVLKRYTHKIGAVCYVLWGIVHLGVGAVMLYRLATEGGTAALAQSSSAIPAEELPQNLTGAASALVGQNAWNLMVFGCFALVVAVTLNWNNSRLGYWLNLAVVSAVDVGFIYAFVLPGYIRLSDGLPGPALWVLAVIFSTIGFMANSEETRLASS
jgi:hypothetical protein